MNFSVVKIIAKSLMLLIIWDAIEKLEIIIQIFTFDTLNFLWLIVPKRLQYDTIR
jgi:hypothetical protein